MWMELKPHSTGATFSSSAHWVKEQCLFWSPFRPEPERGGRETVLNRDAAESSGRVPAPRVFILSSRGTIRK